MKFLLIDDHELIRETMRGALQQLDDEVEILEAADGARAMRSDKFRSRVRGNVPWCRRKYDTYLDQLGVKFPQFVKP